MSAVVASAPPPAPPPSQPHHHHSHSHHHHHRSSPPSSTSLPSSTSADRHISPRHFPPLAPATAAHIISSTSTAAGSEPALKRARGSNSPPQAVELQHSSGDSRLPNGNSSPNSARNGHPPAIKVKKEPTSPSMPTSKRRPNRLDLSQSSTEGRGPQTARPSAGPLTSQQSAGLGIQDVGLACLSPGFQTNDPGMREQLQRSLDVRDQQRQIIEARQKGKVGGGGGGSGSEAGDTGPSRTQDTTLFGLQAKTPMTSKRKGPPPGLAINAPSASQFAHERVIQSAPLHQTFTGLNRPPHGPSALSQTSHIHHIPATQTANRLPPIADVFANDRLEAPSRGGFHSPAHPPVPSPGFPPSQQNPPLSGRTREFRSAEEAVQSMSGGRDDLLPKVVHHYGGAQPPTPPSPIPPGSAQHPPPHQPHSQPQYPLNAHHPPPPTHGLPPAPHTLPSSGSHGQHLQHSNSDPNRPPEHSLHRTASLNGASSRRRGRDEFERDNGSPPSRFNSQQDAKRAALPFRPDSREDWRRDMSSEEKREEFLRLCERAWDLFHS
ncbi:hypothetical protein K431DRAFT_222864 [Polychaeton citri CBS 116435]|uniref:Uncharacterized protein n=1 Tax=Polychaeton citri CBS 116435 TaxID=1314669 RepID=A0A9P4Q9T1_9PEZI|nr:hypothetical protein K431DRAFT_222864 [Polychaeton citri CBS 116435]